MYENGSGERVTLYCTPVKAPTTTLIYKDVEDTGSVQWIENDYGWVVSGPVNKDKLKVVATAAYEQLEPR